jgi:KUP system potassium uptake protein
MLACIAVVVGFRTSSNLAAAYGIAVTSTMVITTTIFAVVTRERWGWRLPLIIGLIGFFLIIDLAFLGANLVKIPQGGWFPLVVAASIFILMTTWKHGSALVFGYEQDLEMRLEEFLKQVAANPPARAPGAAVFLSADPAGAPAALLANLKYNGVLHERMLLTTIEIEETPFVSETERVTVEPLGQGFYQVTVHYGFMEEPNLPRALERLDLPELAFNPNDVPYFVNRTRVFPTERPGMALWREHLYAVMRRNAASAADFFCLPSSRVFEIGTSVEM